MANLTITVTNTLDMFGPAQATKWNAFTWGSANWGQSADLPVNVIHFVDDEGTALASDMLKTVAHLVNDEGTALASDTVRLYILTITEALSVLADMSSESLHDSAGYVYLFPDRVSEGESRAFTTYAAGTVPTSSWTSMAVAATAWS